MARFAKAVLVAGLLVGLCGPAAAYVELSGVFVADDRCQALDSIRRETNPGGKVTVPGRSYAVRGLNKEDGDYVHVDIPGAVPSTRWVSIECGELYRQAEDGDGRRPDGRDEPAGLAPFFDEDDRGPDDPTPRPPALNALDRAVLKVCGGWGSRPKPAEFRAMLDDPALAGEVDRIYRALDGGILAGRRPPAQFKDELTSVWFDEDGFRHVFCGEPSGGTVGGLHFAGRYLQMQEEGWGGMAARCNKTEIAPPIYTFGVRYRIARGGLRTACPKGYGLNLDASEILIEATKGLKLMLPRTSGKAMCLKKVAEPGQRDYLAVFVIKNGAVRTFYPDASPSCDRDGPPENCLCEQ